MALLGVGLLGLGVARLRLRTRRNAPTLMM
jgi:hypothetical protein